MRLLPTTLEQTLTDAGYRVPESRYDNDALPQRKGNAHGV
jgi:hypothetical protein